MKILTFDLSRVMAGTVAPSTVEDCMGAFEGLGHKVIKIEPSTLGDNPQEKLRGIERELIKIKPDLVFALNEYCLAPELLTRLKIPYISWFGDDPAHVMEDGYPSPYYTIFVCDKAYIKGLKEAGFEDVYYLPYGSNPSIFRLVELGQEDKERYDCNVSFAGSSFWFAVKKYDEIAQKRGVKEVVDEAIRIQVENPTLNISDVLKSVEDTSGRSISFKDALHEKQVKIWLEYTAMARYRQMIIRELGDLGLNLYGDDGWKELLKDRVGSLDGIRFLGWADNRIDLVKIYNASKINLNISKSQARTTLPMRVFDILACGAFLLTDYRDCLPEFFELDKEVVSYRDKRESREQAEYFLNHPKERKEIARCGQERILKEHTFAHRMQILLKVMEGKL